MIFPVSLFVFSFLLFFLLELFEVSKTKKWYTSYSFSVIYVAAAAYLTTASFVFDFSGLGFVGPQLCCNRIIVGWRCDKRFWSPYCGTPRYWVPPHCGTPLYCFFLWPVLTEPHWVVVVLQKESYSAVLITCVGLTYNPHKEVLGSAWDMQQGSNWSLLLFS